MRLGNLIERGYLIVFNNIQCIVYDKDNHNHLIEKINILQNKIFAFKFSYQANRALKDGFDDESFSMEHEVWKFKYKKEMVKWFCLIDCVDHVFEGCILHKSHRDSFFVGKSWRKTKPLDLLHANICGPVKLFHSKNKYILFFLWMIWIEDHECISLEKIIIPLLFFNNLNLLLRRKVVMF